MFSSGNCGPSMWERVQVNTALPGVTALAIGGALTFAGIAHLHGDAAVTSERYVAQGIRPGLSSAATPSEVIMATVERHAPTARHDQPRRRPSTPRTSVMPDNPVLQIGVARLTRYAFEGFLAVVSGAIPRDRAPVGYLSVRVWGLYFGLPRLSAEHPSFNPYA